MSKQSKKQDEQKRLAPISESMVSVVLGVIVVLVVGVLVFNYFNRLNRNQTTSKTSETESKEDSVTPSPTTTTAGGTRYAVKAGDTLWSIAEKQYKSGYNWVDIASANKLANPDVVHAGTVLVLPKVAVKTVARGDVNGPGAMVASPSAITGSSYKVVKGDDLWDIAVRACGDGYKWTKIAADNKLTNPDIIHSDNVLRISCK